MGKDQHTRAGRKRGKNTFWDNARAAYDEKNDWDTGNEIRY